MRTFLLPLARIVASLGVLMPLIGIAADSLQPLQPLPANLTLAEALRHMRAHDPNLALAQTALAQAAADTVSAGERPNATLSYAGRHRPAPRVS